MHLCHPELTIATRFCMEYHNMPSRSCNVCKTWLPVYTFVKVQQHNADTEEIALAACEVSHHIQSSAAHLQSTARHGLAPNYLRTLLQSYIPSRSLRSETGNLLIMPKARRKLGCQSFAVAAPKLWNDLPVNIRTN